MSVKELLEAEAVKLQAIENDLSKAIANRQHLESQLRENEMVSQELKALKDDGSVVYKLVGPTLLKQDRTEAQQNIEKRIEYIRGEIVRVEKQLQELQDKEEKKRTEVLALQQKFVQSQQPPAAEMASA